MDKNIQIATTVFGIIFFVGMMTGFFLPLGFWVVNKTNCNNPAPGFFNDFSKTFPVPSNLQKIIIDGSKGWVYVKKHPVSDSEILIVVETNAGTESGAKNVNVDVNARDAQLFITTQMHVGYNYFQCIATTLTVYIPATKYYSFDIVATESVGLEYPFIVDAKVETKMSAVTVVGQVNNTLAVSSMFSVCNITIPHAGVDVICDGQFVQINANYTQQPDLYDSSLSATGQVINATLHAYTGVFSASSDGVVTVENNNIPPIPITYTTNFEEKKSGTINNPTSDNLNKVTLTSTNVGGTIFVGLKAA